MISRRPCDEEKQYDLPGSSGVSRVPIRVNNIMYTLMSTRASRLNKHKTQRARTDYRVSYEDSHPFAISPVLEKNPGFMIR